MIEVSDIHSSFHLKFNTWFIGLIAGTSGDSCSDHSRLVVEGAAYRASYGLDFSQNHAVKDFLRAAWFKSFRTPAA